MEKYEWNKKIGTGKEPLPLTLPLNIEEGKVYAESGDSKVWGVQTAENERSADRPNIVLKEGHRESFATNEEMQRAKKFYEFLKNFPGFGKFVPDTLYFKAKETAEESPKAFCVQKFIKGERIDRLEDKALYDDPMIVNQLLELVNASIELLQTVRKNAANNPDFMRTPELNKLHIMLGALALNPRYSGNIVIAEKPDENNQRVFFVDVGVNANERAKKGYEWYGRHAINFITEIQFKKWKKKLEKILADYPTTDARQ